MSSFPASSVEMCPCVLHWSESQAHAKDVCLSTSWLSAFKGFLLMFGMQKAIHVHQWLRHIVLGTPWDNDLLMTSPGGQLVDTDVFQWLRLIMIS